MNISYSAVVLNDTSREYLLSTIKDKIPDGWKIIAHHMTITMGPLVHLDVKHDFTAQEWVLGDEKTIVATHIGRDEKAMAVKVTQPHTISEKISFPHITIAISATGKPFNSNQIPQENFEKLDNPLILTGTVTEIENYMDASCKHYGLVYLIINKCNSKLYVGQTTKTIIERFYGHVHDSRYKDAPINRAIKKYGQNNFSIHEIEKCKSQIDLDKSEKYWIKYFNTFKSNHYNAQDGGIKTFTLSDETRKKQSIARKNYLAKNPGIYAGKNNPMYMSGYKISGNKNGMFGKKHKQNVIEHNRELGKRTWDIIRELRGEEGVKLAKEKISKTHKGKKQSQKHIEKRIKVQKKAVNQLTIDYTFIKQYESIKEASSVFNSKKARDYISMCCQNKKQTYKGFRWEFVNNEL